MGSGHAGSTPIRHLALAPPIRPGPAPPLLPHGDRPELLSPPTCPLIIQDGCTALMEAATDGHDRVVGLLVKAGADVTLQGGSPRRTALAWAKHKNHAKCVAILEAAQSAKVEPQMLTSSHLSRCTQDQFAYYPQ